MTFNLVNIGHPIWTGLPTSFNSSVSLGYGIYNTLTGGSVIVANCSSCNSPAVVIRSSSGSIGRIAQISYAVDNWGSDSNILTIMINSVKWAAKII